MNRNMRKLTAREEDEQRRQKLSETEFDIDLYSPMFEQFIVQLNARIGDCLMKVFTDEFEDGEITAKIKITMPEYEDPQIVVDGYGEQTTMMRRYKSPSIKHTISLQLKQKREVSGEVALKEHEVKEIDGKYVAVPVVKAQVTMEEYLKE